MVAVLAATGASDEPAPRVTATASRGLLHACRRFRHARFAIMERKQVCHAALHVRVLRGARAVAPPGRARCTRAESCSHRPGGAPTRAIGARRTRQDGR